jgi:hypothetical protein
MTDATQIEAGPAQAPVVFDIKITKASVKGKDFTIPVSAAWIANEASPELYEEIIRRGMEYVLNHFPGVSKITGKEEATLAAAQKAASDYWTELQSGKFKAKGKGKSKVSGAVKTEAMRLARALVKQAIKDAGKKISHYDAKDITEAAKSVLDERPDLLVQAEENLAKVLKPQDDASVGLLKSAVASIAVNPVKVAKANAKKAKPDAGVLSAAKAGQVKQRSKGEGASQQARH